MDKSIRLVQRLIRDLDTLRKHEEREALNAYRHGDEWGAHEGDVKAEAYTEAIRLANQVLVELNDE